MARSSIHRACVVMALALVAGPGGALPSSWVWAAARPSKKSTAEFDRLMAQAEAQRNEGDHAAAARSYAAAHRSLPEGERSGLMGELAVDNALASYRAAYERDPDEMALLGEPIVLLREFLDLRTRDHQAGTAEEVPFRLQMEQERLRSELRSIRKQRKETEIIEAAEAAAALSSPPAEQEDEPRTKKTRTKTPRTKTPKTKNKQPRGSEVYDVWILVGGSVALASGVTLLGGGLWNMAQVGKRARARRDALDQGTYSADRRSEYLDDLDEWEGRWRRVGSTMAVTGSLLLAAGGGLTTWGVLRMQRHEQGRRRASLSVPVLSRERIGLSLTVSF
ncbi:hypothetical protein [Paraliomyxa miuraensis]|uniref:hypothetical protein n=1 Tax=Paraliomyxa miuraensis TaxID=376150 RepID=UPI00224D1CBA|nr:hypothetical protein [Paraliomyxa miuraensis]MCX4243458.1 hypothetical protein [Paraliomyxa miuraensis]